MNKIIKTLMLMALTLVTVVGVGTTKANAAEQGHWNNNNGKWSYYYSNGTLAYDTLIDGKYVVGDDGIWDGVTLGASGQTTQRNHANEVITNNNTTQTVQSNRSVQVVNNSVNTSISYAEFTKIADDKMLELINTHRVVNGLDTLEWDQTLADMATEKDEHMIKNNYMAHSYKNTATEDIQSIAWKHNIDGENCLANYNYDITKAGATTLATSMFNQWKDSPGHNKTMLDPDYIKFGFGFAFSNGKAEYASYGTQQFACEHNGYDDCLTLGPNVPHSLKDFN